MGAQAITSEAVDADVSIDAEDGILLRVYPVKHQSYSCCRRGDPGGCHGGAQTKACKALGQKYGAQTLACKAFAQNRKTKD